MSDSGRDEGERTTVTHGSDPAADAHESDLTIPRTRVDLAHAGLVARIEFLRSLRTVRDETSVLVRLGLSALVLVGMTGVAAVGVVVFGERLVGIGEFGRSIVRAGTVSLWFFSVVVAAFRAVGETGRIDGEAGVLTATSPQSVVLGLLLAEAYRLLSYLGLPAVVLVAAFGVGTADPLVALAVFAVGLTVFATGLPLGYLLGLGALYLSATVPFVRRNRLKLGGLVGLAYLAAIVVFGDLVLLLARSPLAWVAEPLLVALDAGGDPLVAAVALVSPVVVAPAAVVAAERVAVATWYADPVAPDEDDDADTLVAGVDGVLAPFVSRPTVAVTRKTLLRARRAPYTLTFAFVPAFAAIGFLSQAIQTGEIPGSFPVLAAAYAGWGVGSAFTLNPFGDEGALLPVALSTAVSGHQFVRGRVLAAWLVGLPVALTIVAVVAVAAGVPPWKTVASVAFALVFSAVAPLVSVGIGSVFPKFDTRTVFANREAVVPSLFAFGFFVLVLLPLGAPAFLALTFAGPLGGVVGLSATLVGALGVVATAALSLGVGVPSYLLAVRRFDDYSIE